MVEEINVIVIDRGRKNLYLRYTDPLTEKNAEKSAGTSSQPDFPTPIREGLTRRTN